MDIVAHGLWAGLGLVAARRRWPSIERRTVAAAVALAALPDLAQLLPLLTEAVLGGEGWAVIWHYANATPGQEPPMSQRLQWVTHHLHCLMHSAVVAAAVSVLLWAALRRFWVPLVGWWSHIVIDVFTHSADFYPAPVLYPFTQRGFDGIAWNTTSFMVANYTALALAALALALTRRRQLG
jgi:LexA-binding, inner membrane-associated putative hydrolase